MGPNTPQVAESSEISRHLSVLSVHGTRAGCVSGLVTPTVAQEAVDRPDEQTARKGILRRDLSANQLRLICRR